MKQLKKNYTATDSIMAIRTPFSSTRTSYSFVSRPTYEQFKHKFFHQFKRLGDEAQAEFETWSSTWWEDTQPKKTKSSDSKATKSDSETKRDSE